MVARRPSQSLEFGDGANQAQGKTSFASGHRVEEGATAPCVTVIGMDSVAATPVFSSANISAEEKDVGLGGDRLDADTP